MKTIVPIKFYCRSTLPRWVLLLGLLCCFELVQAQSHTVEGIVTAGDTKESIPGVTIVIKGTSKGTVSDINGKFALEVKDSNALLEFNYIGYSKQTVSLNGQSSITVTLEADIQTLDEIVVTGYGSQLKREVTGAVSQIKTEEINKFGTSDFATALQGQLAGVSVRNSSGSPGSNAVIKIRGTSSFQEGGSEPLYVVDGVTYVSNPNIAPQEIASIEVLKDGASAAIYGTRASAGVILITTKSGKPGKTQVSLDSYYGVQNITSNLFLANTQESLFINDLEQRSNSTNQFSPLESNPDALYYNTDWLEELQVNNAPIQNHSLSINGGKEDLQFSLVGTVFSQDGSLINSAYEKQSLRVNANYKKERFKTQMVVGVNRDVKTNEPWGLMYTALRQEPFRPGISPDDDNLQIKGDNPGRLGSFIGLLKQESTVDGNGLNGNLRFEYEIVNGLSLSANLGGSIGNTDNRFFTPAYTVTDADDELIVSASRPLASLQLIDTYSERSIMEYMARYNFEKGPHKLALLAGNTRETSEWDWKRSRANGIASNATPTLSNGSDAQISQTIDRSSLISFLGRVRYTFLSRYNFSASIRRDASSRFGPSNRWGTFPAASVGWNVSEEPFFAPLKSFFNDLKLRYGYALTGSDRIPNYAFTPGVISSADYILGGVIATGLSQPGFADPTIKWETNISSNLGIDMEFFDGRINLNIDIYKNNKQDMLQQVRTSPSDGAWGTYETIIQNVGDMENKGLEIASGYSTSIGELRLTFNGTLTRNVNTITQMINDQVIFGGWPNILRVAQTEPAAAYKEGLPAGALFLIPTDGVIKNEEELIAYRKLDANAALGDLKYVDSNNDGTIDNDDRQFAGSANPDFEYGLNIGMEYKGFDMSIQLYGIEGSEIYNGPKQYAYSTKRHKDLVYAWSANNPDSDIPTPRTAIEHANVRTYSDAFIEDGSFLRVRNLIIGYTLPGRIISKMKLSKIRVYLSAQNPITWTSYTGFDPEVASNNPLLSSIDLGKYPVSATYRSGVMIDF